MQGPSTNIPAQYIVRVFSRLYGLKSCDGIVNESQLSTEQLAALGVLGEVRSADCTFFARCLLSSHFPPVSV